jgi:protein transport protein SEC24
MSYAQPPGMLGQPPSPGQVMPPRPGMLAGPPSSGQIYGPPMHPTAMHGGPPPTGPPFMSGGPAPPRGPPMVPPPGSPGGPMGVPPGGMLQQPPRTRIDPEQMPNPVAMMRLDQEQRGSAPYHTSSRGIPPPLVTTNFTVVDDGISSPRFIRATLYNVPATKDLLNSCRIPLGVVVQPLATIPEQEVRTVMQKFSI